MTGGLSAHEFKPFEVSAAHLIYVGFGAFVVLFASFSLFIKERLYLGEAPIAAVFGIIVGPVALNLFHPAQWGNSASTFAPGDETTDEISLELLRVTIALAVFAAGVELPKKYLLRHWRSLAVLLGPVMVYGWLLTGAFIYALIPRLDFLDSLVVAAAVTPTDPVLSASVVGGPWAEKHVPAHIRHLLICESGCNDGAAFPFLYLALYLSYNRNDVGFAIGRWVYETILYEIVLGTILGALIGYGARKMIRFSERHKLVDRESFVAQYVSLALLSMGVNVLLGSDDLLAAFACGSAFAWDGWFTRQTEDSNFSSVVDLLFNVATFIYIGAQMPFRQFTGGGDSQLELWRLFVIAILTLLFKRIPIVLALWKYIPDIKTFRDALFVGHTAPIGTGAIFISTLGRTLMPVEVPIPPESSNDVLALSVLPITYFFVLCSIAVHGLTIPVFSFSKGAHKVTRTWSRHASFADGGEPSWMTRAMRRTRTGESQAASSTMDVEGGGMDEIRRVLAAQLANIGKGAIGGDEEKQLRDRLEPGAGTGTEKDASPLASTAAESSSGVEIDADADAEPDEDSGFRPRASAQDVDVEKALGGEDGTGSGDLGILDQVRAGRLDDAIDDLEDAIEVDDNNACSEWAPGDDTCEMRRLRAQQAEHARAKEAARKALRIAREEQQARAHREEDIAEAPLDRDINYGRVRKDEQDAPARDDVEGQARAVAAEHGEHGREYGQRRSYEAGADEYPIVREWLEGNSLVLELCKSRCDEPIVEVIHLTDEEKDALKGHKAKSFKWVRDHAEELEHLVEDDVSSEWTLENAKHKLLQHGIPGKLANAKHTLKTRTTKEALEQTAEGHISGHEAMKEVDGHGDSAAPSPSSGTPQRDRSPAVRAADADADADAPASRERGSERERRRESSGEGDESESDQRARADLLFSALHWASEQRSSSGSRGASRSPDARDGDNDGKGAAAGGSRPKALRSRSSSKSPTPAARKSPTSAASPASPPRKSAASIAKRPVGIRRGSLRKKLLAGQIGLSGRRGSASAEAEEPAEELIDEAEEDDPEAEAAAPAASSTAPTPARQLKNFPRSASLGGLGSSALLSPGSGGAATPGSERHRPSSIVWMDVEDKHDRFPRTLTSTSQRERKSRGSRNDEAEQDATRVQFARTPSDAVEDDGESNNGHKHKHRGLAGLLSSLRSGPSTREREGSSPPEPPQAPTPSSNSGILK